jgi:hypothetical protein
MQGVLVFASAAARDAAITSPQEGQCCYLKDTDAVLTYSGAAWVGFDDSNAIQNSIVDAKGDLVAASGADTPARLAVGNNGETLVADSSTSTGLRYQAPVQQNPILNSAYQVWQRGTSFALASSTITYTADRWSAYRTATGCTVSRQVTGDTTNLPNIQYSQRVQRDSGNTSTAGISFYNVFESVNSIPFAGKTVTLSYYARVGANFSSTSNYIVLKTGTGTDQSLYSGFTGAVNAVLAGVTYTTTWARYTYTATLGTNITQLGMGIELTPSGTAGAADWIETTGWQLEVASVATPFKTFSTTLQGELAACQRYYQRTVAGTSYGGVASYAWAGPGTSTSYASISLPVTMRVKPTSIDFSLITLLIYTRGAAFTLSAVTLETNSNAQNLVFQATITGGTAGTFGSWTGDGNAAGYLGYSAEL